MSASDKHKKHQSDLVNAAIEEERTKNYFNSAIITLVFYVLFWPAGLVLNFVYLKQAERTESLIGNQPKGKGCLSILLVVFVWVPLAVMAVFVLIWLIPS